jgi:hypothetical protein
MIDSAAVRVVVTFCRPFAVHSVVDTVVRCLRSPPCGLRFNRIRDTATRDDVSMRIRPVYCRGEVLQR